MEIVIPVAAVLFALYLFAWLLLAWYWMRLVITTLKSIRRAADLYYRLHSRNTRSPSKSSAAEALEQLAGKR